MLFALLQDVLPHDFFSLAAHMPPGWNESYQAGHQRTSASDYFQQQRDLHCRAKFQVPETAAVDLSRRQRKGRPLGRPRKFACLPGKAS